MVRGPSFDPLLVRLKRVEAVIGDDSVDRDDEEECGISRFAVSFCRRHIDDDDDGLSLPNDGYACLPIDTSCIQG